MSRQHTFMDREFRRGDYDPDDQGDFERNVVFVGMPFQGEEMREIFSAIKDECTKLGLNAKRIDENIGSGFIIREITDLIEKSEFLIFDLTHERPNVYYELGYAHGAGNESLDILLIAKEGTTIHLDIGSLRIFHYRSTEHLRTLIASNLKEMIRVTRNR